MERQEAASIGERTAPAQDVRCDSEDEAAGKDDAARDPHRRRHDEIHTGRRETSD